MLITSCVKTITQSVLYKKIIKAQLVVYVIKESLIIRSWQIIFHIYKSAKIFCSINAITSIKATYGIT